MVDIIGFVIGGFIGLIMFRFFKKWYDKKYLKTKEESDLINQCEKPKGQWDD